MSYGRYDKCVGLILPLSWW